MNVEKKYPYPIVLFDGVCNLCNGAVNFAIKRDKKGLLHFASLQSDKGEALMQEHGLDPKQLDTFVFIDNGKAYTKSTAGLKLFKVFGGGWALLYGFMIVPKAIRDAVYNLISNNRYRWFGKRDSCMIPTPELRARFLS